MTTDELINFMTTSSLVAIDSLLKTYPVDLNQETEDQHWTPLTWAVENGDPSIIEILLSYGSDPNHCAVHDCPPLGRAVDCAMGHWEFYSLGVGVPPMEAIWLLTRHGADPHQPLTDQGSTSMDWARNYGFDQALSHFERLDWERSIEEGVAVDLEGMIWLRRMAEAQAMVEADAPDLNQPGSSGRTPLETAIEKADGDMIEFLVAHGADPNLVDPSGMTPLAAAIRFSLEHWDYVNHREGQPSTTMIESLVRLGADPTLPASRGTRYERLNEPARLFLSQFDTN